MLYNTLMNDRCACGNNRVILRKRFQIRVFNLACVKLVQDKIHTFLFCKCGEVVYWAGARFVAIKIRDFVCHSAFMIYQFALAVKYLRVVAAYSKIFC